MIGGRRVSSQERDFLNEAREELRTIAIEAPRASLFSDVTQVFRKQKTTHSISGSLVPTRGSLTVFPRAGSEGADTRPHPGMQTRARADDRDRVRRVTSFLSCQTC